MRVKELIDKLKEFDEQDFIIVRTAQGKRRYLRSVERAGEGDDRFIIIDLLGK